jgi:hypothetical protein
MLYAFSKFIDRLSEFFAHRKGLLPLIGMALVFINGIVQFFPEIGWLVETNLLLHIGVIVAIIGFLVAWAL